MNALNYIRVHMLVVLTLTAAAAFSAPVRAQETTSIAHTDTLLQHAQSLEKAGRVEAALQVYETLYDAVPSDMVFWKMVYLNESLRRYGVMENLCRERLEREPDNMTLIRFLARALYGQGEREDGRSVLFDMIGDQWDDLQVVYVAASELLNFDDIDAALDVYMTARETQGQPALFASEIAHILRMKGEYAAALHEYMNVLENEPDTLPAGIRETITAAVDHGIPLDTLTDPLRAFVEDNPDHVQAAGVLADILRQNGDVTGAYAVVRRSAVATGDANQVWEYAVMLEQAGESEAAARAYDDYAVQFEATDRTPQASLRAARLWMQTGDTARAKSVLSRVSETHAGTEYGEQALLMTIELTRDELSPGGYLQALADFAGQAVFAGPAYNAYISLAEGQLERGEPDAAKESLRQAHLKARTRGERFGAVWLTARTHFYTRDFEAMNEAVQQAVSLDPGHEGVAELIAGKVLGLSCASPGERNDYAVYAEGLYARMRRDFDEAENLLRQASADSASCVTPHAAGALAELAEERGRHGEAYDWYRKAAAAAADTTLKVSMLMKSAESALHIGDVQLAKDRYMDVLTTYPGTVYDNEARKKLREVTEG